MTVLVSGKVDLKTKVKQRYQKVFIRMKVINPVGRHNNDHVYVPNDRASKCVREREEKTISGSELGNLTPFLTTDGTPRQESRPGRSNNTIPHAGIIDTGLP